MRILNLMDSSLGCGWLHKSNFWQKEKEIVHSAAARKLVELAALVDPCLFAQGFQGKLSFMADSCSRDHWLSDAELTQHFRRKLSPQLPQLQGLSPAIKDCLLGFSDVLLLPKSSIPKSNQFMRKEIICHHHPPKSCRRPDCCRLLFLLPLIQKSIWVAVLFVALLQHLCSSTELDHIAS